MRWQKRARLGLAIFGIAFAAVVFFAIGEREKVVAPALARVDPEAMLETSGCVLQRVTGTREDFTVSCERQLAYENGDAKLSVVRIEVKQRQGRDYVITGAEALANEKSREINLSGNVTLTASDGFELTAATASFRESDGLVRTPGEVRFKKGLMSGSGVGMTYDENRDVLTIAERAHVVMVDTAGNTTGEFAAGTATLARQQNYLALERTVHALRGAQTIDAERATARLTENDDALRSIELRGSARVAGGSSAFDAMSARDIDLHYADDGETIERLTLVGGGAIGFKGRNGAPGRQMLGESLALAFAPDGSLTAATGRETVQLDLPAADGSAARHVRAMMLDATGEPGKGMTSALFTGDVEYREDGASDAGGRVARADLLRAELDGNAISEAAFSGRARFEEQALKASGAEARYVPAKGVLRLTGADQGGGPAVSDDRIAVEAEAIDLTLEGRRMLATGRVKTLLQATAKTPGLLKKEQPITVSAARLEYEGAQERAIYTGAAQLWQGETAIRGEAITVDQRRGNLSAVGNARSTLALGDSSSVGRAEEIRYEDAAREITLIGLTPPLEAAQTVAAPKPGVAATVPLGARLSGPEGDLKADRIVVVLQQKETRMERLDAYDNVTLRIGQRVATGARMTYFDEGRYVMHGVPDIPVKIVETCRETMGRTLTFFKSTDRIIVDGNEEIRTRTTSGGPCPQPPSQ